MRFIKNFLASLVIIGVCGLVAGAGTANLFIIFASVILIICSAIGVCTAEEKEETK